MQATINISWFVLVLLLSVRLGIGLFATRLFSFAPLPNQVKVVVTLVLAVCVAALVAPVANIGPISWSNLFLWVSMELVIGLGIALGVQIALTAYQIAGRVLDLQVGFSAANLIDPSTRNQASILGTLLLFFGVMVMLAMDVHHQLLTAIVQLTMLVPPASYMPTLHVEGFLLHGGLMFAYGFGLVMPIVFVLLLIDVMVSIISRTMPQLNVFFVLLPAKILLGMFLLAMLIPFMLPWHERILASVWEFFGLLRPLSHG